MTYHIHVLYLLCSIQVFQKIDNNLHRPLNFFSQSNISINTYFRKVLMKPSLWVFNFFHLKFCLWVLGHLNCHSVKIGGKKNKEKSYWIILKDCLKHAFREGNERILTKGISAQGLYHKQKDFGEKKHFSKQVL